VVLEAMIRRVMPWTALLPYSVVRCSFRNNTKIALGRASRRDIFIEIGGYFCISFFILAWTLN